MQAKEEAGTSGEDDKEEGNLYDKSIEHIQHDQEDSNEEDESEDMKKQRQRLGMMMIPPKKCGITS
eukprot:2530646-Ditylum_brightwellii.AAC.2